MRSRTIAIVTALLAPSVLAVSGSTATAFTQECIAEQALVRTALESHFVVEGSYPSALVDLVDEYLRDDPTPRWLYTPLGPDDYELTGTAECTGLPVAGGAATGTGTDIAVTGSVGSVEPVTVIVGFDEVVASGVTSITEIAVSPPLGYSVAGQAFDISTTAVFTGDIEVCVEVLALPADPATLALLHFDDDLGVWEDITIRPIDTDSGIVCGLTDSLSPFVLANALDVAGFQLTGTVEYLGEGLTGNGAFDIGSPFTLTYVFDPSAPDTWPPDSYAIYNGVLDASARIGTYEMTSTAGQMYVTNDQPSGTTGLSEGFAGYFLDAAGPGLGAYSTPFSFQHNLQEPDGDGSIFADTTIPLLGVDLDDFQYTFMAATFSDSRCSEFEQYDCPSGVVQATIDSIEQFVGGEAIAGSVVSTVGDAGPDNPLDVTITTPNAGTVSITEVTGSTAPAGYAVLGSHGAEISAPAATPEDPLLVRLAMHAPGVDPATVGVTRNGVLVPDCDVPGSTGAASPDPCVGDRTGAGDVVELVVRTSQASEWVPVVPTAPPTVTTVTYRGAPVAGGTLALAPIAPTMFGASVPIELDGTVDLSGVGPGWYRASAFLDAFGYGVNGIDPVTLPDDVGSEIVLPPGVVRGTVIDPTPPGGGGVPNVVVRGVTDPSFLTVPTNAIGDAYQVTGLPIGGYEIRATSADGRTSPWVPFTVADPTFDVGPVDLALPVATAPATGSGTISGVPTGDTGAVAVCRAPATVVFGGCSDGSAFVATAFAGDDEPWSLTIPNPSVGGYHVAAGSFGSATVITPSTLLQLGPGATFECNIDLTDPLQAPVCGIPSLGFDGNGDGTDDEDQGDRVSSVIGTDASGTSGELITVALDPTVPGGATLENVEVRPLPSTPPPLGDGEIPQSELVAFEVGGIAPGATVLVDLWFEEPANRFYKWDGASWLDYSSNVTFSSVPDATGRYRVTVSITDGQPGDSDPTPGRIADPLLVALDPSAPSIVFEGFDEPVRSGVNEVKAGRAVPMKWRVTNGNGVPLGPGEVSFVTSSRPVDCATGALTNTIDEIVTVGNGLQYLGDGRWQLNWKTASSWRSTCRDFQLRIDGGDPHIAQFRFR